jgi:hypothetical protein
MRVCDHKARQVSLQSATPFSREVTPKVPANRPMVSVRRFGSSRKTVLLMGLCLESNSGVFCYY